MTLDDDAVKIILSTKGTMDDVCPEMQRILDYIDGKGASDKFTEELEEAVCDRCIETVMYKNQYCAKKRKTCQYIVLFYVFFVRKITLVFMKLEHSDLYRRTQDTNSYAGL